MESSLSPSKCQAGDVFRGYVGNCIMIDVLDEHRLVDDADIPFSQYRFEVVLELLQQLDTDPEHTRTRPDQVGIDLQQRAVDLAQGICERLSTRCIVVRGLQHLVFTCR
jgi:hypothetical protein